MLRAVVGGSTGGPSHSRTFGVVGSRPIFLVNRAFDFPGPRCGLSDERVERRPAAVLAADVAEYNHLMATDEANAEPVLQDMAARTELHSIDTLTLSDTQFLRGDANGKATTTSGQLRLAKSSGRSPLVARAHGSGGMAPNVEMWARELNKIGVSTFALDGFTGRGLTEVNTNQALLGREAIGRPVV